MGQGRNKAAALAAGALALCLANVGGAVAPLETQRPLARPSNEPIPVSEVTAETEMSVSAGGEADVIAVLTAAYPRPRPEGLIEGHEFQVAFRRASQGDWDAAKAVAAQDSQVAVDIVEWQRLRSGVGTFAEFRAFLKRNGDWPGLKLLRKRGERSIVEREFAPDVIAYFQAQTPQTGYGILRLSEAYAARGNFRQSRKVLIDAWVSMEMTSTEEAAILADHAEALKPHHPARLDDALWRRDREGARRMLGRVSDDAKALAAARLALQGRSSRGETLMKAVPEALTDDPGLARDYMRWLVSKKRRGDAAKFMVERSTSAASLGRPEAWAEWRRTLARQEMRAGRHNRAYALASQSFLTEGSDYADLEWLAGYLALRFLDKPTDALTHFRHFRSQIYTPISLGRAGYWEGRALEAMGEGDTARDAYRDAARHQTSFYGLLAAEHIGVEMDPDLTGSGGLEAWQGKVFAQSSVFAAAKLFHAVGQQYEVTRFLRHLSETTAESELVALGDFAVSLGDPYISVRVGKQIAREGVVAHRAYYPLTEVGEGELPVHASLALAIARRESEFYSRAVSGAGARGLMQLMPGTAQDMARKLKLPYERGRLTADPVYNAKLGSAYLAHLIEEFGDNVVLVSVGYNAGPHRARTWSEQRGDPRNRRVDVVDWIEHIPFDETRNYVMRVAESLPVYRARLSGKTEPIAITKELKAR